MRAFVGTLLGIAWGCTLLTPAVYAWVDDIVGIPNIARPLANASIVLSGWSVQRFLWHLNPARRARVSVRLGGWLAAGTILALVVLFWLAELGATEAVDFTRVYGSDPYMVAYRYVFLGYLGVSMYNVSRQSWALSRLGRTRRPEKVELWLGTATVAAGAAVSVGYVAHEAAYAALRTLDLRHPASRPELVTRGVMLVGAVLIGVGSTMPAWGKAAGVRRLYRRVRDYQTNRELEPLHRAVCGATPEVRWRTGGDLGPRWYRRLIEIEDGCLDLRSYVDRGTTRKAHDAAVRVGLHGEELRIEVAAAGLRSAIRAKVRGVRPVESDPGAILPGGELEDDRRFYERVAGCYARPRIGTVEIQGGG